MKKTITAILVSITLSAGAQQPQKKDTANYMLIGKFPYFQLTYRAVESPGDVTPNQKEAVLNFLRSFRMMPPMPDSVKATKPSPKAKAK